ncbi:hypothetical protein BDY19DRAFT_439425 [Irpex rosettiformis]|uniref:Uncharacterized protein n=1 Tax=Irpex rosettiformis TaxID=378272 RepID=A0ACB8TTY6_9APHY|nr:hypothetical protein BDY19DRAFT_439425 [Irpex rosettiformis]
MDGASAIIGIVAFGFTVFNKVDTILKTVRGASEELATLQELSTDIEVLLLALQRTDTDAHLRFRSPEELAYLDRLRARTQRCLEQVEVFAEKVQRPSRNGQGVRRIKMFNWYIKKNDFDDIARKMKDLESSLGLMMAFVNS